MTVSVLGVGNSLLRMSVTSVEGEGVRVGGEGWVPISTLINFNTPLGRVSQK
jgi:hypothetical protein